MKMRTSNYLTTIQNPNSEISKKTIAAVRSGITSINYSALLSNNPKRLRVTVRGRLGKNNPHAYKYKNVQFRNIPLNEAQHVDIYIHDRNPARQ